MTNTINRQRSKQQNIKQKRIQQHCTKPANTTYHRLLTNLSQALLLCGLLLLGACGTRDEPTSSDSSEASVQPQFDVFLNQANAISDGLGGGAGQSGAGQGIIPSNSDSDNETAQQPDNTIPSNPTGDFPVPESSLPVDAFKLLAVSSARLVEGNAQGADISLQIERGAQHTNPVRFSLASVDGDTLGGLSYQFTPSELPAASLSTGLNLRLDISVLPRLEESLVVKVIANDGIDEQSTQLTLAISPIALPDVYLLAGGTNMVGRSFPGRLQASSGEPDAPVSSIKQLRVEKTSDGINEESFISFARDPLHDSTTPIDITTATVGLGLSFAKAALGNTTQNIVLVPTALEDSAFCNSGISGWQSVPERGNTLLFDRAMLRLNKALTLSGGIFRGILWHQGDADATGACAASYRQSLMRLASDIRREAIEDARGATARRDDSAIPFVVGTLGKGSDSRGDFSTPDPARDLIDNTLRNIQLDVAFSATVLVEDLVPSNGYPCGASNCADLGAAALRELGARYYSGLLEAAGQFSR